MCVCLFLDNYDTHEATKTVHSVKDYCAGKISLSIGVVNNARMTYIGVETIVFWIDGINSDTL